jgi:hypothetical protein
MADQTGMLEETKKVLTNSEKTLGEQAPGTPFALMALSYLAVLAVACGTIALVIWSTR